MENKLKFAPIIRVSTEKQAQIGESLQTQKSQIISAVKQLGGVIPKGCWKYCGQEHATPDQERRKFNQLLSDADKRLFDAVIVSDLSRWSRDNRKSKEGLDVLRNNGVRFFVLQSEMDLKSAEQSFFIGMSTEINEFQARMQRDKSLMSRIARAKKGYPSAGKLPYGRTFNKKSGEWGIDKEKQKKIGTAARLYLAGRPMKEISKLLGLDHASLHKTLTKRSGDKWIQSFKRHDGTQEEVVIKVPSLLDERVIRRIHNRSEANRTYLHGKIKHGYLLARMIFCKECGYAMFGQTNHSGKRYYRHARHRKESCKFEGGYLPADMIEPAVLIHLFSLFQNPYNLQKAVEFAFPDAAELSQLRKERKIHKNGLSQIAIKRTNLLDMVEQGALAVKAVKERVEELNQRESMLLNEISTIDNRLSVMPTTQEVRVAGRKINELLSVNTKSGKSSGLEKEMVKSDYSCPERLFEMNYAEQRYFLQYFFGSKDHLGKRNGVYVSKSKKGVWHFEIRGLLGSADDRLPLSSNTARLMLGIEDENVNPVNEAVCDMHCQCHAYNRLGFY